ncbi:Bifunctional uridylyltransferase/uridylyl-removing enzyme [Trichinella spiralis]|uniref:Bifunctional uridylyltransferase/uridylyl-removing enzyme n=1 Tax=Trichinella spiralis TaxID=6334 RepID=A0ABR3KXQ8_TRISP
MNPGELGGVGRRQSIHFVPPIDKMGEKKELPPSMEMNQNQPKSTVVDTRCPENRTCQKQRSGSSVISQLPLCSEKLLRLFDCSICLGQPGPVAC